MVEAGLQLAQHRPHSNGKRLDLSQALHGIDIELIFIQKEELGLGEERRQRIREVMPQPAEPLGVAHRTLGQQVTDPL